MTMLRTPELQQFLTTAEAAIRQGSAADPRPRMAADRIFTALRTPSAAPDPSETARLPVCRHLDMALEHLSDQPAPVRTLADAFAAIEPRLNWKLRAGAEAHGETFLNGHAGAVIAGPEGLEIRRDVRIGVSLMAPHVRYPDHRHPPEEVYIVLSNGEWRQDNDPWHAPGIGGLVYNPPDIVHAMRSLDRPLLALWFLWTEDSNT